MHVKQAAERAGYGAGAAGVVLVTSVIVSMITGLQQDRDRYRAAAEQPRPTVTKTETRPPVAGGTGRRPASASPSPTAGRESGATVLAAGESVRTAGGVAEDRTGGSSGAGGGSSSGSGASPPAGTCRGRVVSVRLPLGVLPKCALTAGGSR